MYFSSGTDRSADADADASVLGGESAAFDSAGADQSVLGGDEAESASKRGRGRGRAKQQAKLDGLAAAEQAPGGTRQRENGFISMKPRATFCMKSLAKC